MRTFIVWAFIVFSCFSCQRNNRKTTIPKTASLSVADAVANHTPVFGYRFIVEGDFDGNGRTEKLVEHYVSRIDNMEAFKYYGAFIEWDILVDSAIAKEPWSFAISDNGSVDTLHIAVTDQLLGLAYMKNEGDLDGDGGDELSYVIKYADWSSMNTWHIVTYKKGAWKEFYHFDILEWQLPDLPDSFNTYGLFGPEAFYTTPENDTMELYLQRELENFPGLVKNLGNNKIQIIHMVDAAEPDTMVVDVKKIKL